MLGDAITDVQLASGTEIAIASWERGWQKADPISVSDWADKYRVLPRESSSEPGQWRTDRMPHLREIMDCLSAESSVSEVTLEKSTQAGGSEVGINWLGYIIEHNPGPTMYVLTTIDVARKFSQQRLRPMVKLMPCLAERIGPETSRAAGNTTLVKEFPGGLLVISGANSSSSLATMPIKNLILDELSKYPTDLDDQGTAEHQAIARTSSFTRRKVFRVSSPTIKDACAIDRAYNDGDQSELHLPCPFCERKFVLHIDQLTDDGQFLCPHCGKLIAEHHKPWMLARHEWIARKPERSARHRSFHIWAAHTSIGLGYSWKEIAEKRAAARKDPALMPTFVNTILGNSYEGASQRVDAQELSQRAGKWVRRTIPRGLLILTAGVDVQANRFAVQIVAWGRNEKAGIIDYVELPADPTRKEDWSILWDYLAMPIANAAGIPLRVSAACVDSGNWTQEVYNAVRPMQSQGVLAIKGSKEAYKPVIGRASKQDTDKRGGSVRRGVNLWLVGVNTAKTTLMQRLLGDGEREEESHLILFPGDLAPDYYTMLTAERFDLVAKRWIKKSGVRNESLDTLVYAYAAALSPNVRVHLKREADWASLEAKLEPAADLFTTPRPAERQPAQMLAPADRPITHVPAGGLVPHETHANPFATTDWMSRR